MDSSADRLFYKTLPTMNMSAGPSCCDCPPSIHCQQFLGHPLIRPFQNPSMQTHRTDITEATLRNNAMETDIDGRPSNGNIWSAQTKTDADLKLQQKLPPVKKIKALAEGKSEGFEDWDRKRSRDREELKEEVGELKERLQTLQEKVWKALNKKRRKDDPRDEEERGLYGEEHSGSVDVDVLQGYWWKNNDSFSCDCDRQAKFAQLLKVELGSAVARVIDRVLRLYAEGTESTDPSPTRLAAASFLDESEKQGCGIQVYKRAKKDDEKDVQKDVGGSRIEPLVQMSEKLLPQQQQHLHQLLPPMLAPSSHPDLLPSSSFPPPPPPHLGPFPLMSMQEVFSQSLSHQAPLTKPFHLSAEVARPVFNPAVPVLGFGLERGERRVDVGVRRAVDLIFTAGSQEGLSPCHLKKAKLMFFYARYPSSSTLKTYFPDVKFKRCVTSQMIKWFSNFREFFYIQMERFARQAVKEALALHGGAHVLRDRQLRVDHSTELYRVLNMHYNKSNVYQVPDGFIRVCEVALREFYSAIWSGRDSDPSWKKIIYKIICKLDSPVPEAFLLPGCPLG